MIGNDLDRLTGVTYHDSDTEAFNMDDLPSTFHYDATRGNRDGNQTLRDDSHASGMNFVVDEAQQRGLTPLIIPYGIEKGSGAKVAEDRGASGYFGIEDDGGKGYCYVDCHKKHRPKKYSRGGKGGGRC